uniref:Uncharacterized protein n=1 Tax=Anguilla anguilla TaxID=7936 RepID=A0A0E9XVQ3_ANGAN
MTRNMTRNTTQQPRIQHLSQEGRNLNRTDTDETQEGTMNNQATEREGKTRQPGTNN